MQLKTLHLGFAVCVANPRWHVDNASEAEKYGCFSDQPGNICLVGKCVSHIAFIQWTLFYWDSMALRRSSYTKSSFVKSIAAT